MTSKPSKRIRCSAERAAALLEPVDTLAVPLGPGQPPSFLRALGDRDDWRDLHVFGALLVEPFSVFTKPGVRLRSGFFGPAERGLRSAGHAVAFVPADFRRFATIAREFAPRVMATAAAEPDDRGRFSLSLHAGATVDELRDAGRDPDRLLIVETSRAFPRTRGAPPEHPHALELADVDVWIESDATPLVLGFPTSEPGRTEQAIAEHVAPYIKAGATIQTGIGDVPSAVVGLLADGRGGDYGIHSEMFTDGLMRLCEAGKVSNRKGVFDGLSVATFALGTRELYDWLHERSDVAFLPVHVVNDPAVIARNRDLVSLNSALCVDLFGQLAADDLGSGQYSGIGGHEDFLAGAGRAACSRSLICLPSTTGNADAPLSRIAARLPADALVTSPRHQVDVVVTEFGAAELEGRSVEERADALAAIAHPDFREELLAAAHEIRKRGVLTSAPS